MMLNGLCGIRYKISWCGDMKLRAWNIKIYYKDRYRSRNSQLPNYLPCESRVNRGDIIWIGYHVLTGLCSSYNPLLEYWYQEKNYLILFLPMIFSLSPSNEYENGLNTWAILLQGWIIILPPHIHVLNDNSMFSPPHTFRPSSNPPVTFRGHSG